MCGPWKKIVALVDSNESLPAIDFFQALHHKYGVPMMSALRSNFWRFALLPVLLTASLLLPTLHLHPVYEHDHDGPSHQHAVVHADFLAALAHDHRHAQQKDVALGDSVPAGFSQISLAAFLARGVESQIMDLEKTLRFLVFDLVVTRPRLVLFARILRRDHPPPVQQIFLAQNAPRSPPQVSTV